MSRLFFLFLLMTFFSIGLGIGFLVSNRQSTEEQALIRELLENQEQSALLRKQCEDDLAKVQIVMSESNAELVVLQEQVDMLNNDKADMAERITQLEAHLVNLPIKDKQTCDDQWNDEQTAIEVNLNDALEQLEAAKAKIADIESELAVTKQELETLHRTPPIQFVISR